MDPFQEKADSSNSQQDPATELKDDRGSIPQSRVKLAVIALALVIFVGILYYAITGKGIPPEKGKIEQILNDQSFKSLEELPPDTGENISPELNQQARQEYLNAVAQNLSGDRIGAIQNLKKIADSESYPRLVRAYAVEYLGRIYSSSHDPKAFFEIFKGEPYVTFLVRGDVRQSIQNIFGYASTFYPIALSEFEIAKWLAIELKDESLKASPDTSKISSLKGKIAEHMKLGEKHLSEMKKEDFQNRAVGAALNKRAITVGYINMTGDQSFGDANAFFEEALKGATTLGQRGFINYNKAVFLMNNYGNERKDQIIEALSPFYKTNDFAKTSVVEFFSNERHDLFPEMTEVPRAREDIINLAKIDPNYKEFLLTLGWTEADFSKAQ